MVIQVFLTMTFFSVCNLIKMFYQKLLRLSEHRKKVNRHHTIPSNHLLINYTIKLTLFLLIIIMLRRIVASVHGHIFNTYVSWMNFSSTKYATSEYCASCSFFLSVSYPIALKGDSSMNRWQILWQYQILQDVCFKTSPKKIGPKILAP